MFWNFGCPKIFAVLEYFEQQAVFSKLQLFPSGKKLQTKRLGDRYNRLENHYKRLGNHYNRLGNQTVWENRIGLKMRSRF